MVGERRGAGLAMVDCQGARGLEACTQPCRASGARGGGKIAEWSILLRRGTALVLQVAAAADAAVHVRWLAPPLTCVAAGGGRRRAAGAGVIVARVAGNGGDDVAAAADGQVLIHDSVVADEIDDVDARHVGHVVALLVDDRGVDVNGELIKPSGDLLMENKRTQFNPLIRFRENFDKEMRQSIDEVR